MSSRVCIAFCALSTALALACSAAEVSPGDAARAAAAWCAANAGGLADGAAAVSVRSEVATNGILLWHEVSMSDGGCAFVAPDDRINPVIAYVPAFEGPLPAGHPLRAMLEGDLRQRLAAIADAETTATQRSRRDTDTPTADDGKESGVMVSVACAQSRWQELVTPRKSVRAAGTPSLVHSFIEGWATGRLDHWNQNGWNRYGSWKNLYDLHTPEHHPCGCVATVGAALLQHFGVARGPAKTNECAVDGVATNLATKGRNYDWSLLPETWSQNQSLTEAQIDLLGRATYDMGVCLGMSYDSDGSSASISTLASSLRTDFGLADARCFYSGVSAANYPKLIYHQLRAGTPVVLSLSREGGGHAVLAVGCGEDDAGVMYTRVFMGWGGSSDGWYQLPEVDKYSTLDGVITMLGADTATLALCGRVTTTNGTAAAFEKVSVSGVASAETETDANGFWAVRVKPAAGLVTVSCTGAEASAEIGAAAAASGGSVGAGALAAALPASIDLVSGQAGGLTTYSSPAGARLAALRQGKLLFLQLGAEWCGPCLSLRAYLKELGTAFSDDFVFCYLDTDKNAYGFDDGTFSGIPAWAVIDPRRFDPADHWNSEGILHMQSGYSSYSTDYWLADGRKQWATLGAPPAALVAVAPATLAMPKALRACLRFPDGTECDVTGAVSWSLASGTAATLSGNMLTPVAGASGEVEVNCEGTFWGTPFAASATVRVIGGVSLEALEIEGPGIFDLYDEPSAQFSAVAVFSDGSRAEVDAEWSAETSGTANYLQCSADGQLSFTRDTYTVYQCVTVTVSAVSGGMAVARDILVYGPGYVKPVSVLFSQDALWPGAELSIVPQKVQWWRHGVLEPPTDDLTDIEFSWQLYCYGSGRYDGSGTNFKVPADAVSTNGNPHVNLYAKPVRKRYYNSYSTYKNLAWHSTPIDLFAVDFDGNGGSTTVARVLRTPGASLGSLPEATKRGCLFDGWFRDADGVKLTSYTIITNSFSCKAKWLQIASVDIQGPDAAAAESEFVLVVSLANGSTHTVTNGVAWSLVSGNAATINANGTLVPIPGKTGNVELRATATLGGDTYSLCRTVRILDSSTVRSLRIEGPELIDLYDVPSGLYRAYAATADGEFEVTPAWTAEGIGASYMQISSLGELSFRYDTYTVYQCATAVVTAVCCGLTNSVETLLYGPGYVKPVSFVFTRDTLWPGAGMTLVPQQVQWWRHGVLEAPTDDLSDVEFSWSLYCSGSGRNSGSGTNFTVPSDAFSTNGYASVYLYANPARERYYYEYSAWDYCIWSASPVELLAVDFDAAGGTATVARVLRSMGSSLDTLPEALRPGYFFAGWFAKDSGNKVTASTVVSNAFTCTAKWLKVESVDILGPSAATEPSKFALVVALEDGTTRTVTNGVAWTRVSGDAATLAADGTLSPVPGRTGDVEVCASAMVGNQPWSLCKTVRILDTSAVQSLRIEGPELIDLYDVPGGRYRAFAGTSDGEYEVAPAWSAESPEATYMQISEQGELSFRRDTYTVYQCTTTTVTAVCCGLTNSMETLLYGPGYVMPVSFALSRNAIWPGAEVTLVPQQVQWWRHGMLEAPTDDLSDVEFGWSLYCSGSGWHFGNGTNFTVPTDAISSNGTARIYLDTTPARGRYYSEYSDVETVHFLDSEPARWVTVSFDANGGETACASALYLPGEPYRFLPALSRMGYTGYWYTERQEGVYVTTSSDAPTADATLHAQWTPNYYWIEFDGNGAEGSMSDQCFYYDTPATLRTNAFAMEGDTFAGWALAPDGEAVFADGATILNLSDTYDEITLYAVWPKTEFVDITFYPNGGTVGEKSLRAALGRPLRALPLPKRAGHAFAGWYTAPEGGTHVRPGMRVPGPATLYAHWAEGAPPTFAELAFTNVADAIEAAVAEGKLLFVLHGADWCGYCGIVEQWLATRWAEVGGDFAVYYCDGDHDDTISGSYPQYGVFDPAAFAGNWKSGCYAYQTGGSDSLVENLVTEALRAAGRLGEWGFDLSPLPEGATADEVAAALAAAGFVDPGITRAVAGNAAAFNALVGWSASVKTPDGTAPAGTAAVLADSHAAAAFLLGAERLFQNAPVISIESIGTVGKTGGLSLDIAVRDGFNVVPVSQEKVGGMFESVDSPFGWEKGTAPAVESAGTDADGRMRFEIHPAGIAPGCTFIRLRK